MKTNPTSGDSQIIPIVVFALYSVIYEAIIWGVFGYSVFWLNHSGWWMLLAVFMSVSQMKPRHFGVRTTSAISRGGSAPLAVVPLLGSSSDE